MKLWSKGFEVNKEIERFTVGKDREMDLYLAKYDVLAGRVLFYGANKHTLRVTTPLTFRRIDMHHPKPVPDP